MLAANALGKFTTLSREARIASVTSIAGALSSTSTLFHLKESVQGVTDGSIVVEGNDVAIAIDSGYVCGHWNDAWRYALNIGQEIGFTRTAAECVLNDICGVGNQRREDNLPIPVLGNRGLVLLWLKGMTLENQCYAFYYNPSNGDQPTTGVLTTGC